MTNETRENPGDEPRLESWKEIAAHLQRGVKSVQRWERDEGLPVHRHHHGSRSSVYAYPGELDAWRAHRKPAEESEPGSAGFRRWIPVAGAAAALLGVVWLIERGPILNPPDPQAEAAGVVGMNTRLVSNDPFLFRGSPFPDGERFACVDWTETTGEISICDLKSGKATRLTHYASSGRAEDFAYYSVASPDGKWIAYSVFHADFMDLRVISAEARESHNTERTLLAQTEYVHPFAWSPDGRTVVAGRVYPDGDNRLVTVSVDDGEVTVLKSLGWRWPEFVSLSPDGKWITYDVPVRDNSPDKDIFLLAGDGSRETKLIERGGLDYGPVWTPDGRSVLFASDRAGDIGLWSIDINNGKPAGPPREVKPSIGRIVPAGMSPGGKFFYGLQSEHEDIYVAELGPDTGKVLEGPRLATDRFVGLNYHPAWSPDGERLAYFSRRRAVSVNTPGALTLVMRDVASGQESEHATTFAVVAPARWFPDGQSMLVPGRNHRGRWFLYRVDARTGKSEPLTGPLTKAFRFPRPAVSPDGKTVYYIGWDKDFDSKSDSWIVARNLATEESRKLHRVQAPQHLRSLAISPDGRRLAFVTTASREGTWRLDQTVSTMPVTGGAPHEIYRTDNAPRSLYLDHGLEWSPDGEYLILPTKTGVEIGNPWGGTWDMLRIPASGGKAETLLSSRLYRFPTANPDGRRIAFDTSSVGELGRELWVLENFLPVERAAK